MVVQVLYSYCIVIVQLLYSHCTVIVKLLYSYCTAIVQSLYSYCTVIIQLLYSYYTVIISVIVQLLYQSLTNIEILQLQINQEGFHHIVTPHGWVLEIFPIPILGSTKMKSAGTSVTQALYNGQHVTTSESVGLQGRNRYLHIFIPLHKYIQNPQLFCLNTG